jgi:hypothetical protein
MYASAVTAAVGGGDRTGFVYNTSRLSLASSTTVGVGTPSYRVIGNNGQVPANGVITATANMPQDVVTAFGQFSDHLPVAAKYGYRLLGDATGDDVVNFRLNSRRRPSLVTPASVRPLAVNR